MINERRGSVYAVLTAILTATAGELRAMSVYEQVFAIAKPLYFLTP